MRNTEKKIMIISIVVIFLGFVLNLWWSFTMYPQIILNAETLYGEGNQNLKDFEIVDEGIISVSGDPWIEYYLEEPMMIKAVELDFSGITETAAWGEVFARNNEIWESSSYDLQNGKTLLYYKNKSKKDSLRFDLVSSNSTYLEIERVVVNSRYGMACKCIKQLLVALLYVVIYEEEIFLLLNCIRNNHYKNKKRIFAVACMILPFILLGVLLFNFVKSNGTAALFTWMYMVSMFGMIIVILEVKNCQKRRSVIDFIEVFIVAFLNIGIIEVMSGMEYNFKNIGALFVNIIFAAFPICLFCCILRRLRWAMLISNFIFVVIGVINHYFYIFRDQPFEMTDFLMANTALTVLGQYVFQIDYMIIFAILVEIGMICYFGLFDRRKINRKELLAAGVLSLLILVIGITHLPATVNYWDMIAYVQKYGYINTFVAYAKNDLFHDKPEGYSTNKVENILEAYADEQESQLTKEYPNIIVIMNEAFADLPNTYEFETTVDGMPFMHSMKENTIKGNILVSVFGGNTANTEYEFLSGNTMAFLGGGDVPYMQFVKREQHSLAQELKKLGYQTIAFHPCVAENYNRNKVYPLLGFDEFIAQDNELAYSENLRTFMSDRSDFYNVIDIYEKRDKEQPFYMFNVTIQNHGGYSFYQSEVDVTVKPDKEEYQYVQLMEYLSLIRETDSAFEELIEYFENVNEKTIILMFGDHQPGLDAEIYNTLNYGKEVDMEQKYSVPFIVWANFDIESKSNVLTSPNYLRATLLKTADIPLSRYDQFLLECQNEYPAINRLGYYDNDGKFYRMGEALPVKLQEYQILQYANMFDKGAGKYFGIR